MQCDHHIQPKKQDNRKSSSDGVGDEREMEGMNKIGKMGVANIGGLQKIGGQHPSANYVERI